MEIKKLRDLTGKNAHALSQSLKIHSFTVMQTDFQSLLIFKLYISITNCKRHTVRPWNISFEHKRNCKT